MQWAKRLTWMIPLGLLLVVGLYNVPPVHDRLGWRLENLRTQVKYFFNPPDEAVFKPEQQINFDSILATTRAEYALTLTPRAPEVSSTPPSGPTAKPTVTSTPLPALVDLKGFRYEDQHNRWNYCGPANFSMALNFWGWDGNRDVIGKAVKPSDKDKNVMPYEFQDFIAEDVPGMTSVMRYGGDIDLLKRFLAAGYPVVAEKGYYERDYAGKVGWMGHYQFITGYDDSKQELIVQDTYNDGPNFHISYKEFMDGWRSFNYLFVVVYPATDESQVVSLLGPLSDEYAAASHALDVAQVEARSLIGNDRFFAWFNAGTSHVALQQYMDAAAAYDNAFDVYAQLGDNNTTRPYRMMWYQTGPYWAYFYSARYADVINLANTTLKDTIASPDLEESLLWRARAYYMAGQTQQAISDYRAALKVHPGWTPAVQGLRDLGLQP
jgi:tetratricopeptide (TPR) repeat protein